MLLKNEKIFFFLFITILILEIITGSNSTLISWHYVAKPMILISLLVFYWYNSKEISSKTRILTALALLCSLSGDILLMFVEQSPHFFTLGLASFLVAHVVYSIIFFKRRNNNIKPYGLLSIFILYAAGLFFIIKDNLGAMLLPVFFYMLVILVMAISAFIRKGKVEKSSFMFVFLGAILFLLSDSLLALNKFYTPLQYSNISIMFTYAFAQLFIVFGLLKQR